MRSKFFIIPAALIFQVAGAQNGPAPLTVSQTTLATISVVPSTSVKLTNPSPSVVSSGSGESIMDYKSVYDAATAEEETQLAAERFSLSKSQQDVWLTSAIERRQSEKQAYDKLNSKDMNYSKDAVYMGLRISQNAFYETVIGYLNPDQKQALELDRTIRNEKQRRLAKLPPPPPPAPIVTVAPIDSAAVKEQEKIKAAEKKPKKKKKAAGS